MTAVSKHSYQTRQVKEYQFAGPPSILSETHPPTLREVLRFYYYLKNINEYKSINIIVRKISIEVKKIWLSVNPRLPLIQEKSLFSKVKRSIIKANSIHNRLSKKKCKESVMINLDKLFRISACTCALAVEQCDHRLVKFPQENCSEVHVTCTCPRLKKVKYI